MSNETSTHLLDQKIYIYILSNYIYPPKNTPKNFSKKKNKYPYKFEKIKLLVAMGLVTHDGRGFSKFFIRIFLLGDITSIESLRDIANY